MKFSIANVESKEKIFEPKKKINIKHIEAGSLNYHLTLWSKVCAFEIDLSDLNIILMFQVSSNLMVSNVECHFILRSTEEKKRCERESFKLALKCNTIDDRIDSRWLITELEILINILFII